MLDSLVPECKGTVQVSIPLEIRRPIISELQKLEIAKCKALPKPTF
jgi:hypothetical protein